MPNPFRKYLVLWTVVAAAALTGVGLFNLVMDPFCAYGLSPRLDEYKARLGTRRARAEIIRRGRFRTLLLGSSRSEIGVRPLHPAWGGGAVYSASLEGTNMYELAHVFRYAMRTSRPDRVVLFADFFMFTERRQVNEDFDRSRFDPSLNLAEYHLENLFSIYATKSSWRLLRDGLRGRRSKYTPLGNLQAELTDERRAARGAFQVAIRNFLTNPETYFGYQYGRSRIDCFREVVTTCRERRIELTVVILPVHALQLETIDAAGLWDTFERWKRDLTAALAEDAHAHPDGRAVPLWDFTGYHFFAAESVPPEGDRATVMRWWAESSHLKPELGDLVVWRITGRDPPGGTVPEDFGILLTPANVESHLARIRADREAYRGTHAEEIDFVRRIAESVRPR